MGIDFFSGTVLPEGQVELDALLSLAMLIFETYHMSTRMSFL